MYGIYLPINTSAFVLFGRQTIIYLNLYARGRAIHTFICCIVRVSCPAWALFMSFQLIIAERIKVYWYTEKKTIENNNKKTHRSNSIKSQYRLFILRQRKTASKVCLDKILMRSVCYERWADHGVFIHRTSKPLKSKWTHTCDVAQTKYHAKLIIYVRWRHVCSDQHAIACTENAYAGNQPLRQREKVESTLITSSRAPSMKTPNGRQIKVFR